MRALKIVAGVILGWLAAFATVMVGFTLGWFALGFERLFVAGTFGATPSWCITALGIALVGGLLGGLIAACVGGDRATADGAPRVAVSAWILAAIILVFGLLSAASQQAAPLRPPPDPFPTSVSFVEFTEYATQGYVKEPAWFAFSQPFVGAFGVIAGAMVAGRRRGVRRAVGSP